MLTKSYVLASVKFAKDDSGKDTGEVTAVVSVFGNVDSVGDRVVKGAFAKSLYEWRASGDPIPMLWSHDWTNPMSHIGAWDASKSVETDEGLQLTGVVDIDNGNPVADQAYKLLKSRLVREFSFAYDVIAEAPAKDGANDLLELAVIEAGPCLKGANSDTRLVEAKSAMAEVLAGTRAKVGRTLSQKNEDALNEALGHVTNGAGAIKAVLDALKTGDEGKARGVKAPGVMPAGEDEGAEDEAEGEGLGQLQAILLEAAAIVGSLLADEAEDEDPTEDPAAGGASGEPSAKDDDEAGGLAGDQKSSPLDDVLARLSAVDAFATVEYRTTVG